MIRYLVDVVVFVAGLAVVGWIGAGYVGTNPIALAVTLLIGAFYLAGALELLRYRRANAALLRAVAQPEAPSGLDAWLERVPAGLRQAVRLRIEGARAALPGPTLAPYVVGLLVLLGMLGTFLGMVATLRGTGAALESATDLQAIRASLAAPVKGLGFAFGTSVAGVATSAMLGLLSALCRRERIQAGQQLDARIATTLRPHTLAHQREETFRLLQRQAEAMPAVVDRLQAMMDAMAQQAQALDARLLAGQEAFHGKTEAAYARLAGTLEQSLRDSAAASARAAGEAIQPAVEATLAGLARQAATLHEGVAHETAALHDAVARAAQQQLEGLSSRFEASTTAMADLWRTALADHQQTGAALAERLQGTLDGFAGTFEQRSASLLEGVAERLETTAGRVESTWTATLARQEQAGETLAQAHQQALAAATADFAQHAAALLRTMDQSQAELRTALAAQDAERLAAWTASMQAMEQSQAELRAALAQQDAQRAAGWTESMQAMNQSQAELRAALAQQDTQRAAEWAASMQAMNQSQAELRAALAQQDEQRLAAWTASKQTLDQSQAELHATLARQDGERLAAWTASLGEMVQALRQEWEQAGAQAAQRQQQICDALARTADDISAQTRAHASGTLAEIAALVQAASEAPKAAAEITAELRERLSDSMARDNAMLEERNRLLQTLETLLGAINHASNDQRAAFEALTAAAADLVERVGAQLTGRIEAETGKLATASAQVTGSAVEVASLGEAFGAAVQQFSQSNAELMLRLERIEAALDKSLARSDEQLAYYVAQAKEVIDLSLMSQKQIVEDLQQLADRRAAEGTEAA